MGLTRERSSGEVGHGGQNRWRGRGPGDRARTRPLCSVASGRLARPSGKPPSRAEHGSAKRRHCGLQPPGAGRPPAQGRFAGKAVTAQAHSGFVLGIPDFPRDREMSRAAFCRWQISRSWGLRFTLILPRALSGSRPPAQPWWGRSASVPSRGRRALWGIRAGTAVLAKHGADGSCPPPSGPHRPSPARRRAPWTCRPHLAASCHFRPLGHSSVLPRPSARWALLRVELCARAGAPARSLGRHPRASAFAGLGPAPP